MNRQRKVVLGVALALLAIWLVGNLGRIMAESDGLIRLVLGFFFGAMVIFRPKKDEKEAALGRGLAVGLGIGAAVLALAGVIFEVHQFEWLGLILVVYTCLRWALPSRYGRDILLGMLLIYWVHPLPGQIFGGFQLLMQRLSVMGSEWALHCLNIRVWADGLILRTGFQTFAVPEACSGMRTAVTVFLSALGVGILLRFSWWRVLVLMVLGVAQVLALNILRVTTVVYFAPKMSPEWSQNFLHDSAGVFLLAGILLIQLEASYWRMRTVRRQRIKDGRKRGVLEQGDKATRLPRVWYVILKWGRLVLLVLAAAGLVAAAVFKSRPAHREAMRSGVIDGLVETRPEGAQKAIDRALKLEPKDRVLRGKRIRVLIMRGKFAEALDEFENLTPPLSVRETVMKSWSLMASGRAEEAVELLDSLPDSSRSMPPVAMIRAEFAALQGDPATVSRNIVLAGHSNVDTARVRSLFPYLAAHEQWSAISEADDDKPYEQPHQALISAHSHLKVNDLLRAGRVLEEAIGKWPDDPRFLGSLFTLVARRPGGEWERLFAESFRRNLLRLEAEQISRYMGYCFRIHRPDLAWMAFTRLAQIDPKDPSVLLAPAQFGANWFRFRRHELQVGGEDRASTINLVPFLLRAQRVWPVSALWDRIPLARELCREELTAVRDRFLKRCLDELAAREREGRLSRQNETVYPAALAAAGRFDEAHSRLDGLLQKYPDLEAEVLIQHAELYDRENRWEDSYEKLIAYYAVADLVELQADLMMVNALMNLNLGVYALDMADRARTTFPGASEAQMALAAIWDAFGFKEEALFLLSDRTEEEILPVKAQLLADTGRFNAARSVMKALGMIKAITSLGEAQPLVPPPAELTLVKRWPEPMIKAEMAEQAAAAAAKAAAFRSPFLKKLEQLTAEWFRRNASPEASDPDVWRSAGRNPGEQASALHRLGVLLARQQRYDAADAAISRGVTLLPNSPVLRRIQIVLRNDDPEVVRAAAAACPDDSDLWLASLVSRLREEGAGDWLDQAITTAADRKRFPVEAMVRAGDFALRAGRVAAAADAGRYAIKRGEGLLSAYVLGLQCALRTNDVQWALSCALSAIEQAVDPAPFYRAIVQIKATEGSSDADMIAALEYLKQHFPAESLWAQHLGQLYFEQGDAKRALSVLEPVIGRASGGVRVRSLLLASEAARLEGELGKAVSILQIASSMFPDNMSVLNNLVYSLAQDSRTISDAQQLLPELLEIGRGSFAVLDTAAMVYLRSDQINEAKEYMQKAVSLLREDDYAAAEVKLNAARIMVRTGEYDEARRQVMNLRKTGDLPSLLNMRALQMLEEIESAQQQAPRGGR